MIDTEGTDGGGTSRRAVLGLAASALPGCTAVSVGDGGDADEVADVRIDNVADSQVVAEVAVTRVASGSEVLSETVTLPPDGTKQYHDVVETSGTHRIRVVTGGGQPATYEWRADDGDAVSLHVSVGDGDVEFAEAVV